LRQVNDCQWQTPPAWLGVAEGRRRLLSTESDEWQSDAGRTHGIPLRQTLQTGTVCKVTEEQPHIPMEQARKSLAEIGHRALVERKSTVVTRHGRPYFLVTPPPDPDGPQEGQTAMRELDQRLRAAVAAGDDQAVTAVADEIEAAGLPALAEVCRTKKSAGLREPLAGVLGMTS